MSRTADAITERLDRLENDLPSIPAKSLRLTRATTRRVNDVATTITERAGEFVRPVARGASTATKTVVGQARSAADRSVASIRRGRNETVGQFNAQAKRTLDILGDETGDLLDDATASVAPETVDPASLHDLSKAELYERAQALDIEGRSAMSKAELVGALRAV
jgi:hypothetical protein